MGTTATNNTNNQDNSPIEIDIASLTRDALRWIGQKNPAKVAEILASESWRSLHVK